MANTNETKRVPAISATYVWVSKEAEERGDSPDGLKLSAPSLGADRTIWLNDIPGEIGAWAVLHGIKQKLVDAAAISRNPDTGASASVLDKWQAILAILGRIMDTANPRWNAERGEGMSTGGLLLQAIIRLYPSKTPEALKLWLDAKSAKEQAALRLNPKVSAIIETIKAERAKAGDVDSDSILGELEAA